MLVRMTRSFLPSQVRTVRVPTVSPKVMRAAAWTHFNVLDISGVS